MEQLFYIFSFLFLLNAADIVIYLSFDIKKGKILKYVVVTVYVRFYIENMSQNFDIKHKVGMTINYISQK